LLPDAPIRALILGSFPSVESMRRRQYYGNPRNWFWRVLEACGVIPDAMGRYEDRVAAMLDHGIAVWDLYLNVQREGSGDSEIVSRVPNDLRLLWDRRGPFPILLNGYRIPEWRRYFGSLPVRPTALPSTSPRPTHWNTAESRREAIGAWQTAIADLEPQASEPDA
jgi:hypoxanthine-DNA glycosylase